MSDFAVKNDYAEKLIEASKTNGLNPKMVNYTRRTEYNKPTPEEKYGSVETDLFWVDDLYILFRSDRLKEFFPSKKHTVNEQLNALARFFCYLGAILAFSRRSSYPLFFASLLPLILICWYYFNISLRTDTVELEDDNENFEIEKPTRHLVPTVQNPFMNPDPTMYGTADYLLPPANVNDPNVQKQIRDAFQADMIRDGYNIDDQNQAFLHFNFVPRTLDFGEFANYLYKLPEKSYKEDSTQFPPFTR